VPKSQVTSSFQSSGPSSSQSARIYLRRFFAHFHNVLLFVGGFVFDWFTVGRIDSWIDIAVQLFYLTVIAGLLVLQQMHVQGAWKPRGRFGRLWPHNDKVLHFLYGALLSVHVVLYVRSSAAAEPAVFLVLLGATMVLNELPQIRRFGFRVRLGLYTFALATLSIYLVPLLLGYMGRLVFVLSLVLAALIVVALSAWLARWEPEPRRAIWRLAAPGGIVLVLILVLYFARLIPPVPLSVQGHGIYHGIARTPAGFVLRSLPSRFRVSDWKDSRPFRARPGDKLVYFVRLFAPAGFNHRITIRWERRDPRSGRWLVTDRIPLEIVGGRALGFRGHAAKENYEPGAWRVRTESEDGRTIGLLGFEVLRDPEMGQRTWVESRM
jgi:hypothetical protein